jgi:hypothetical protein
MVCAGLVIAVDTRAAAQPRYPVRPSRPAQAARPAARPTQQPAVQVRWDTFGRSVEGRPLEFIQFGDGAKQVLVVGALAGTEPEGVAAAEMLAKHLATFPRRIEGVKITIVRDPNPDGRARRTAGNARGVVLDRNFPESHWRRATQGAQLVSGSKPASEPETLALVELCEDLKPDRVVLLGTAKDTASVLYAGPAEDLARQVTLEAEARLLPRQGDQLMGSLVMLAGEDWGVPTLLLSFPPRATADEVFSAHKTALMTAVGCGTAMPFAAATPKVPWTSSRGADNGTTAARPSNTAPMLGASPPASPYLGAFGAKPAPVATAPVDIAPNPSGAMPLNYASIQQGRPTVPINRSRQAMLPQPLIAPAATGPSLYPGSAMPQLFVPRLDRLPPVDLTRVGPPVDPSQLPQSPIPAYPEAR